MPRWGGDSMKRLKLTSSAVALAVVAISCSLAGSASATTLCSSNTTPCNSFALYPKGTKLNFSLSGTASIELPSGAKAYCYGSSLSATTSTVGGLIPVSATIEELYFTACNGYVNVLKKGSIEINHLSESMSGSVVSTGTEITTEVYGIHCIYSTSHTPIGTLYESHHLVGGIYHESELVVGVYLPRTGGRQGAFCGAYGYWEASYVLASPTVLYVSNL